MENSRRLHATNDTTPIPVNIGHGFFRRRRTNWRRCFSFQARGRSIRTSPVVSGGSGAFAEMALANGDSIAHKPKILSYAEACSLPLVGVSAWQALVENIGLSKDQKILIHGGAGGIGSIAIQLAKHLGAYVATTVSTNDKQFVQELGGNQVIDYKTQNFEDIPHDYDAVFDTVAGETYRRSFKVLKKSGIIVSMLEQPNSELMNRYGVKALFQFTQVNRERLTKLAHGWIKII